MNSSLLLSGCNIYLCVGIGILYWIFFLQKTGARPAWILGDCYWARGQYLRNFTAVGGVLPDGITGMHPFPICMSPWSFFHGLLLALYVFVEFKYKESIIGVFVSPLIFLSIAYASFDPSITSKITPFDSRP